MLQVQQVDEQEDCYAAHRLHLGRGRPRLLPPDLARPAQAVRVRHPLAPRQRWSHDAVRTRPHAHVRRRLLVRELLRPVHCHGHPLLQALPLRAQARAEHQADDEAAAARVGQRQAGDNRAQRMSGVGAQSCRDDWWDAAFVVINITFLLNKAKTQI